MLWDVFISYASEDREAVARPLRDLLVARGLRVWFDDNQLQLGDSLRAKIDEGLEFSAYGVVVLSDDFFAKSWPKRELDGLYARDDDVVLPVWHRVGADDVRRFSPTLAGRKAIKTEDGLEAVADKIASKIRPAAPASGGGYETELDFPVSLVERAFGAIETLSRPATWPVLSPTRDMEADACWMGTDSAVLVEILYDLMAPLVLHGRRRQWLDRNRYTLSRPARLQAGLLEAAFVALTQEYELALGPPEIAYTPRVSNWRAKRARNPGRYWWQGVSEARFADAARYFLTTSGELLEVDDFHEQYRVVFGGSDGEAEFQLGVLANALYGFTPSVRPVYWRLLLTWARLYRCFAGSQLFDPGADDPNKVGRIFEPRGALALPLDLPEEALYEPLADTTAAIQSYLDARVVRQLRALLVPDIA